MRVLITGGTGFGSHTVAAVARAGHAVRLLVRRPERADTALAPLRISVQDIVSGDVLEGAGLHEETVMAHTTPIVHRDRSMPGRRRSGMEQPMPTLPYQDGKCPLHIAG